MPIRLFGSPKVIDTSGSHLPPTWSIQVTYAYSDHLWRGAELTYTLSPKANPNLLITYSQNCRFCDFVHGRLWTLSRSTEESISELCGWLWAHRKYRGLSGSVSSSTGTWDRHSGLDQPRLHARSTKGLHKWTQNEFGVVFKRAIPLASMGASTFY